jgi:hypothetical protein
MNEYRKVVDICFEIQGIVVVGGVEPNKGIYRTIEASVWRTQRQARNM